MHILHYALGFPPYRSGGLTKFCMDLMKQQVVDGHQTALIWPGEMKIINKKTAIKDRGDVVVGGYLLHSFEIINPLPVSFDEGISNIAVFTQNGEQEAYRSFLDSYRPDVLHVHTFMGLHRAFLEAAKAKGIKVVFTAHDFYPICPKVTMYRDGEVCETAEQCTECGKCNTTALSIKKIQILQSPLYRTLKDSFIVKKLRKQHRDNYLRESSAGSPEETCGNSSDFKKLRNYYRSMIELTDVVHYNSSITKAVYERFFWTANSTVINITHGDIKDHKKIKSFPNEKIRMRYLGPQGKAKGFFYLKETLDRLWTERTDFCLDIQFDFLERSPYIRSHERYDYSELEDIFDCTDVLIVPSLWYETFGYTVLEALSYGVPVILTGNVGAKDILTEGAGIVIENTKNDELHDELRKLTKEQLRTMNKVIVEKQDILTLEEMSRQIERQCYSPI